MTLTRRTRWLVFGVALALAVAVLPLANTEIRSFMLFKIAPAYARRALHQAQRQKCRRE